MITVVKNIRQLVTARGTEPMSGPAAGDLQVREGVTLVIRGDRIAAVEPSGVAPKADCEIDAGEGVVVPGLVDACITARGGGSLASDEEEARGQRRMRVGVDTLLRHGTTSLQVLAVGRDGDASLENTLANLQQLAHRCALRLTAAFVASPDGSGPRSADRISRLIGETIPTISRRRLASTCALRCGEDGYSRKEGRAVLRAARGAGLSLRVQATGLDVEAILLAADLETTAIDHLSETAVDTRRLKPLRQAGTLPVLLPAEAALHGRPAGLRPYIDAGLAVALGSGADLTGGGVLSLWTVVALAVRSGGLSLPEALTAATLNAAAAIGASQEVGTLEPGKLADFLILNVDDYRAIPDFVVGLPIHSVVIGGKELSSR